MLKRLLSFSDFYRNAKRLSLVKSWELSGALVARYYGGLLLQHGTSARALAERADLKDLQFYDHLFHGIEIPRTLSVLDIGCGMGNLIEFLHGRGTQIHTYVGIDLVQRFIEVCRNSYQEPYQFRQVNFVSNSFAPNRKFNLVVNMGMMVSRVFRYEQYVEYCVRKMLALSSKHVVFNAIIEVDSSLGNYKGRKRIGHITYIPKNRLVEILNTATRDFGAGFKINEVKVYPDATDAFVQITLSE